MVTVEVNKNHLKLIENRLGNLQKSKAVLKKAVNDTAKQARKELAQEAQKTYAIKNGKFNKAMKIKQATNSNPTAIISATGGAIELKDFKVSPAGYKTGKQRANVIKGKVLKPNGMKALVKGDIKSFIVKFSSGHITVAQRDPHNKMKNNPKKDALKVLYSPSIPKMIGNEKRVFKTVKPNINKNLMENINKHIEKVLGG